MALPNGSGAQGGIIFGFCGNPSNCTIGGTTPAARNLISGNIGDGVGLGGGSGNTVQGNLIGTDVTGTLALANGQVGVAVGAGSTNALIGGTTVDARNVISGNGRQIAFGTASNNTVQGNFIGTNITGTVGLPGGNGGISLDTGSSNNVIGGLTATPGTPPGNLISGNNGNFGVDLGSNVNGTVIQGNIIGADITGTQPLGNLIGIHIGGHDNTIGGTAAGAGTSRFQRHDVWCSKFHRSKRLWRQCHQQRYPRQLDFLQWRSGDRSNRCGRWRMRYYNKSPL